MHSDTSIKTSVINDYVPVISVADENTIFVTYRGSYSNSNKYNYYINEYSID